MKRLSLSPDEIAIIEGLRHEKAIYNAALADALAALSTLPGWAEDADVTQVILALRK